MWCIFDVEAKRRKGRPFLIRRLQRGKRTRKKEGLRIQYRSALGTGKEHRGVWEYDADDVFCEF